MLSVIRSLRLITFSLAFLVFLSSPSFAAVSGSVDARLADIKVRLVAVIEGQKKVLENQQEMLELIKQLKIWARRKGRTHP